MKKFNLIFILFLGWLLVPFFAFAQEATTTPVNATTTAEALPDIPNIILRKDWGADEAIRTWQPEYVSDTQGLIDLQIKKIVLHDTASINLTPDEQNNASSTYKGMVRSIYRYHTFNAPFEDGTTRRGFGDTGYHYLVDLNGNIYQGRFGGNGAVGAQVYGFNYGSLGISVIGTYGSYVNGQYISHSVSENLKNSLIKLFAWLTAGNSLDLTTKSDFFGKNVYGLISHRDLSATQDPGNNLYNLMSEFRTESVKLAQKYSQYLYQVAGDNSLWQIKNGRRYEYKTLDDFLSAGNNYLKIVQIPKEQLEIFWPDTTLKYADGALLKTEGDSRVYLYEKGQKKWIASGSLFEALKLSWAKIKEVFKKEIEEIIEGPAIREYPEGTLLKVRNDPAVYQILGQKKRLIISASLFERLGFLWPKILEIPGEEINWHEEGEPLKWPNGSLLRQEGDSKVYLIKSGQKLWIKTPQDFESQGFKWENIIVVSAKEASYYSLLIDEGITVSGGQSTSSSPLIKIALFSPQLKEQVKIKSSNRYDVLDNTGQKIYQKERGEITVIEINSGIYAKFVSQEPNNVFEILSFNDPNWNKTLNYNQFRGTLEIKYSQKSGKFWAVNELPLEDYLRGVAETSQGDPFEYIKALTVAARTYAYYYLQKGGKYGSDEIFHLKNTSSDQLYKGYGREKIASDIVRAVNETQGEIITYNGGPIVAAYSSGGPELLASGTKSGCSVWGGNFCQPGFEYLKGGVIDPVGTQYTQQSCGSANHCVGMSGAGARQFAKTAQKNYQEILKYYYLGAQIKN